MTTAAAPALAAPSRRDGRTTRSFFDPTRARAGRNTTSRRKKAVETTGRRTPSPDLQAA